MDDSPIFELVFYLGYYAVGILLLVWILAKRHGSQSFGRLRSVLTHEFDTVGVALYRQFRPNGELQKSRQTHAVEHDRIAFPEGFAFGESIAQVDDLYQKTNRAQNTALILVASAAATFVIVAMFAVFFIHQEIPRSSEYYPVFGLTIGAGVFLSLLSFLGFVVFRIVYVVRRGKYRRMARDLHSDLREALQNVEVRMTEGDGDSSLTDQKDQLEECLVLLGKHYPGPDKSNS